MKKQIICATLFLSTLVGFSQVGIGTETPEGVLDVVSANSGIILPRVARIIDITSPTNGMLTYVVDEKCFKGYQDGAWIDITTCSVVTTGSIGSIDNNDAEGNTGSYSGGDTSGVSIVIEYSLGNGLGYDAQSISSTGVTGVTASLAAGTFASGSGSVTYTLSGTPSADGTASFSGSLGGHSLTFDLVFQNGFMYHVVETATGEFWLDRNLGATRRAITRTDGISYGDLYQWGRNTDGHQERTSSVATGPVTSGTEGSNFITNPSGGDWLSTSDNTRWNGGTKGIHDPCPSGFRVPSSSELVTEKSTWSASTLTGAFNSILKVPSGGRRTSSAGNVTNPGISGYLWSSDMGTSDAAGDVLDLSNGEISNFGKAVGFSVRCIKE